MADFQRDSEFRVQRARIHHLWGPLDASAEGASFVRAADALKRSAQGDDYSKGIELLGDIFCNCIDAGNVQFLTSVPWEAVARKPDALWVLEACASLSTILRRNCQPDGINGLTDKVTQHAVLNLISGIISETNPLSSAVRLQVSTFCKAAEQGLAQIAHALAVPLPSGVPPTLCVKELIPALCGVLTKLMVTYQVPGELALLLPRMIAELPNATLRHRAATLAFQFLDGHLIECSALDDRLPAPLGRASFQFAVKEQTEDGWMGQEETPQTFYMRMPDSAYFWNYIQQRLEYLRSVKNPEERAQRLVRYLTFIPENLAGEGMQRQAEDYFQDLALRGKPPADRSHLAFFRDRYGVGNGPAPDDSPEATQALRETHRAFRLLAATRFSLNTLKGYTRGQSNGQWLLQDFADAVGGSARRFRELDIDAYPGPGVLLSGLDPKNALDLESARARGRYAEMFPWLKIGMELLPQADLFFLRAFLAIGRKVDDWGKPPDEQWAPVVINGEPYVGIWFNDHFHVDRHPEVRMWALPEKVFAWRIGEGLESGIPLSKLDLTPEGFAEVAHTMGLPIFSFGTNSVLFGGFCNAWPFGMGPAFNWERYSGWRDTIWQDPFHIHRSLASGNYSKELTPAVERAFQAAWKEHIRLGAMLRVFQDLHATFVSMEEAWAKEQITPGQGPATLSFGPPSQEMGGTGIPGLEGFLPLDLSPELSPEGFSDPRTRTRILNAFLELRNQVFAGPQAADPRAYPILELQHTRLFVRQAGTPYIQGADLSLHLPDGRVIPLVPAQGNRPGKIIGRAVYLEERMEAEWLAHMVSRFAPGNCPRIVLP